MEGKEEDMDLDTEESVMGKVEREEERIRTAEGSSRTSSFSVQYCRRFMTEWWVAVHSINFPLTVLLLSSLLAIISAVCFKTHSELARAVQARPEPTRSSSGSKGGGDSKGRIAIFNPFTMTVAGFGIGLFGAALVLPP